MLVPVLGLAGLAGCSVPVLSPAQIYQLALSAGFPDDPPGAGVATQMTAIALRESSGCPTALNTTPPDYSEGLWQININPGANAGILQTLGIQPNDLFDPATNARAAFTIWGGSPSNLQIAWGGNAQSQAMYQAQLPIAQAAALSVSGDGSGDLSSADGSSDSSSFMASLGLSNTTLAIGGAILAGIAVWALAT